MPKHTSNCNANTTLQAPVSKDVIDKKADGLGFIGFKATPTNSTMQGPRPSSSNPNPEDDLNSSGFKVEVSGFRVKLDSVSTVLSTVATVISTFCFLYTALMTTLKETLAESIARLCERPVEHHKTLQNPRTCYATL